MIIDVSPKFEYILKDVFIPIILEHENESFSICMRDGAFEFYYGGKHYSAKNGVIKEL